MIKLAKNLISVQANWCEAQEGAELTISCYTVLEYIYEQNK